MEVIFPEVAAFAFMPLMDSQGPSPLLTPMQNSEFALFSAGNPFPLCFEGKNAGYCSYNFTSLV